MSDQLELLIAVLVALFVGFGIGALAMIGSAPFIGRLIESYMEDDDG